MRVLHVAACPYPSPQGSQVYVRGVVRSLAREGVDVTVAAYAHGEGGVDEGVRVIRTPAVPGYRRLRSGPDPVKPALDLALLGLVRRTPADLLHAHNYEGLAVALAARRGTGVPVVYSAHTLLGEELPTYLRVGRRLARAAGEIADRSLPRRAAAVIALSTRGATALRGEGCRRVRVIPPGVEPDDFLGCTPIILAGPPTVAYVGNPDAYQELDTLYRAVRHLSGVQVLVVTFAVDVPRAPPGVTVVRARSWSRARDLLAGAAVAVVPRSVCAGFPVKLLQSLALGVPTVVARGSAQGIPGEVVVADRDPVALAAGIARALQGPRPDPARVFAEWGSRVRVRQVLELYDELLGAAPRA